MQDLLWLGLFVLALACGWLLGRFDPLRLSNSRTSPSSPPPYAYLLDSQPDEALQRMLQGLEVNDQTLDTHFAVGRLLRKRGEVGKAIQVHQNLLASPQLGAAQSIQVRLALAEDFLAAGVLSRAEKLFIELTEHKDVLLPASKGLLRIYEQEREWSKAIDIAERLAAGERSFRAVSAHYHCELAEHRLRRGDLGEARQFLAKALRADPACARASLMLADIEERQGRYAEALDALIEVRLQQPAFISETLGGLQRCAEHLGTRFDLQAYLRELVATDKQCGPAANLLLARQIAERNPAEASQLLQGHVQRNPSLEGLKKLIDLVSEQASAEQQASLTVIADAIERLSAAQPRYRCERCGFAGKLLHWQCPACHGWGVLKPSAGGETGKAKTLSLH